MQENLNTAEEFASSESFIAYYLRSDESAITYWERWISLHPEKLDEVLTAERMLDVLHLHLPQEERDIERSRLISFISKNTQSPAEVEEVTLKRSFFPLKAMQIAAMATLIVSAVTIYFAPAKWFASQQSDQEWASFTSPKSQRSTIRLSDGTAITLNSGSTLIYPKSFKAAERMVKLTGQAFFEVKHDKEHPFIVTAGKVNTRVLGTTFTVSGYKGKPDVEVALLQGSVRIITRNKHPDSLLLHPGEKMVYHDSSGQMTTSAFDAETETGWKDGITAFRNADFKTIAATFDRNYDLKIVNKNPLKKLSYTGSYQDEDPVRIIKAICFSLNMTYKINGRTIYLSSIND